MQVHREVSQVRSHLKTCAVVRGIGELDPRAGEDEVDFGHAGKPTLPEVASAHEAWACWTSARTPATCSSSTPTVVRHPLPAFSYKEPLRLAEHLDDDGAVDQERRRRAHHFVADALVVAGDKGCEEMLGFATSAVRDATNCHEVLDHVKDETGVDIEVLPGEDEARLTFLAVRRWFGWSSGRMAVFDIGGGSLEIAVGSDEAPDVAHSLPLGAGRLTRDWLSKAPADDLDVVRELRLKIRAAIARDAGSVLRSGAPDHAVATSKTFRSLARICGAPPSGEGPLVRRVLAAQDARAR